MDTFALQRALVAAGQAVTVDGVIGPRSRAAVREALSGPSDRLAGAAIDAVAAELGLTPAHVGAVVDVESRGHGMDPATGLPIILFEPHQFSRLTARRFDRTHPTVSYRRWGARSYPRSQGERWDQMMTALALDPGAALASASWGLFQIMGFNHVAAGYATEWEFARAMAGGEAEQLAAFGRFLRSERLIPFLRDRDWAGFARRYNGPAYAEHAYDKRLAAAFAKRGGR